MIVAAHQPNFLPWLGYFDKMRAADVFISLDHVPMERPGPQNRTRIKTGEGDRWLAVPVLRSSARERIMEKEVDNSREGRERWTRKSVLALKYAYQSAPYYSSYAPVLNELLDRRWGLLTDLNHALIAFCRGALGIRTPMVKSSDLRPEGEKSRMLLGLCRAVGADAFLCGSGASRDCLDLASFERAGIRVLWQDFSHPRYVQHPGRETFIEGLSAVDALFNCGASSARLFDGRVFA